MKHFFRIALVFLAATTLMSGCSLMAPKYTVSIDNVQKLKDMGSSTIRVGDFTSKQDKENANPIFLRTNPMNSPYQNSYAKYLEEALKEELAMANKMSSNADVEVTGVLMKNDLDFAGMVTGNGKIEARFIVKKGDQIIYDQVKTTEHEWPSAFAGFIAINRAMQEYPSLVQKLLGQVYGDKEFADAIK